MAYHPMRPCRSERPPLGHITGVLGQTQAEHSRKAPPCHARVDGTRWWRSTLAAKGC